MSGISVRLLSESEFQEYIPIENIACGICEKEERLEDRVYWPNPMSAKAHKGCFEKIKKSEDLLLKTIFEVFAGQKLCEQKGDTHIEAIRAVKRGCNGETILSYFEKRGEEALTSLFNTVGLQAAKDKIILEKCDKFMKEAASLKMAVNHKTPSPGTARALMERMVNLNQDYADIMDLEKRFGKSS